MLIVMGIIIILMAAGIAGGRFAIQRANRIQKQNAVDNIEQALWGYYTDNRSFPREGQSGSDTETLIIQPGPLLETNGALDLYMDAGAFDGGIDGLFWYFVNGRGQEFVVCAQLSDVDDNIGIYCKGNGLDNMAIGGASFSPPPPDNIYRPNEHDAHGQINVAANGSFWDGDTRSWN